MVAMNNIPGNVLVPFWFAEINSGGTPYQGSPRLLLIGQKTAGGSAAPSVPLGPIQSDQEADALFGVGSMLSFMFRVARAAAPFQPIWALPLADPAGAAAAGTITVNTAPGVTAPGVLHVMGRRIVFQVNAADTRATVAASIAAAINGAGLPIVAAIDGTNNYEVDVTARHVGALGNGQEVAIVANEPNALTSVNATIVALAGGSGTPSLAAGLSACGDDEFDTLAGPYADATSLDAIKGFLSDQNGRWGPMQQLYGHYWTANFGTLSGNVTLGNSRNDQHVTIIGSQRMPVPEWEVAASAAGMAQAHLGDAPEVSRPLQTLALPNILPPRDRSLWFKKVDRQALYSDGIASYTVDPDYTVRLDRCVTTFQQSPAGVADRTFLDAETMYQMMFVARYFRTAVSNRHSRQALADDNPFNLPEVATPRSIRDTLIHAYADLVAMGVLENLELFAQFVDVQRDPNDANRVNVYLPVDVVNQLRVFAANITTFLQYRSASGLAAV